MSLYIHLMIVDLFDEDKREILGSIPGCMNFLSVKREKLK